MYLAIRYLCLNAFKSSVTSESKPIARKQEQNVVRKDTARLSKVNIRLRLF